jgi:hypothetical protein
MRSCEVIEVLRASRLLPGRSFGADRVQLSRLIARLPVDLRPERVTARLLRWSPAAVEELIRVRTGRLRDFPRGWPERLRREKRLAGLKRARP